MVAPLHFWFGILIVLFFECFLWRGKLLVDLSHCGCQTVLSHLIFYMQQTSPIVLLSLSVINLFVWISQLDSRELASFVAYLSIYWALVYRLQCGLHNHSLKCHFNPIMVPVRALYHMHELVGEPAAPFYESLGSINELKCGFMKQTVHAGLSWNSTACFRLDSVYVCLHMYCTCLLSLTCPEGA